MQAWWDCGLRRDTVATTRDAYFGKRGAMIVRRCRRCGFPKGISDFLRWSEDGTITERVSRDFRAVLVEADFLPEVFSHIERELGHAIGHLVFEAQRIAAAQVIQSNMRGYKSFLRWPGMRHLFVRVLALVAVLTGQGYARILAYRPGKKGEAFFRNAFHRELMAAIVVGSIETLDRTLYDYQWRDEGEGEVISLKPSVSHPGYADRLNFVPAPAKPGRRSLERCPSCKAPLALTHLEWRVESGEIYDPERGVRMVILDLYTPNVVLRELARELGDDVYPLIVEAGRSFSLEHLRREFSDDVARGDKEGLIEKVMETLALRGLGNAVGYSLEGGRLSVCVENPYNPHLLAGMLAGLYQLLEGGSAAVDWREQDPSTIEFSVMQD
jgi:hypothetical protein